MVLAIVAGYMYFLAYCQGPVTRANFDRLQPGMSEREVREILGEDAVLIVTHEGDSGLLWCNGGVFPGYSDSIEAWFDTAGTLKDKTFTRAPLWRKVQRVFLPREETDRKLYLKKHWPRINQ